MVNKYFYHHGRCRLVARSTDLSSLSFRILTILLTVACLVAGHAEAYAQSCTSGFTSDWIRNAGYVDQSNGKVTYTYQIGSMSSSMVNAILTAIARWNAKSSDMVIVGSPGAGQDLHFSIDNSIDDPCAAKWQSGTEISMTSDLQTLAGSGSDGFEWAVHVMEHEIGHFYRPADMGSNWSTIMGNAPGSTCAEAKTNWDQGNGPTDVTSAVASAALSCVDDFRYDYGDPELYSEPEYPYQEYYPNNCYDYWWCSDVYWCYDGCEYDHQDCEYLGYFC